MLTTTTPVKQVPKEDIIITIDPVEQAKIWWYVDRCSYEISGLGKVVKLSDNHLHVSKIYLLEQECSSAETELDDEAVAKLLYDAREEPGEMLFWWHSHVNMAVFWSKTDYEAIYQLGKAGMVISTVYNKKREKRTSLFVASNGYSPEIFMDKLDIHSESTLMESEKNDLEKQYTDKVTLTTGYGGWTGYSGGNVGRHYGGTLLDDKDHNKPLGNGSEVVVHADGARPDATNDVNIAPGLTPIIDLFNLWEALTPEVKASFIDAYGSWSGGHNGIDWTDPDSRRDFLEFCEYYKFDFDELDVDWGYSGINAMVSRSAL